jgi:DNA-binding IclR family transcriptional regulator
MPIRAGGRVLGCLNLTWRRAALTEAEVADRYLPDLRAAVRSIERQAVSYENGDPQPILATTSAPSSRT